MNLKSSQSTHCASKWPCQLGFVFHLQIVQPWHVTQCNGQIPRLCTLVPQSAAQNTLIKISTHCSLLARLWIHKSKALTGPPCIKLIAQSDYFCIVIGISVFIIHWQELVCFLPISTFSSYGQYMAYYGALNVSFVLFVGFFLLFNVSC